MFFFSLRKRCFRKKEGGERFFSKGKSAAAIFFGKKNSTAPGMDFVCPASGAWFGYGAMGGN
jgi:hypothetical protein